MKDYTSDAPVWSDSIPVVEENDLVNAENDNAASIQLLQNILVLKKGKVDKEKGKGLVSETEKTEWNAMYQQATGYTDQKIADLINGAPSTLDTLGEIAEAMKENEGVVGALEAAIGSKANEAEFDSHVKDAVKHITAAERTKWNGKMEVTGDSANNTVTFSSGDAAEATGWTDIGVVASGEKHSSLFPKVSLAIKNLRYLWKVLGTTSLEGIGDGTVTGAINELNTG
ncbi:MAG: hypothetical protein K2O06_16300, partial [Acetatifactor sp.]|nr:hypothetical protein [Acetatifactor sp.]